MHVSRHYRQLVWLGGILALLGLCYASLPWLLMVLIKQQLAARDLADIQLRVDYPTWRGLRVHALTFTAKAGDYQLQCEIPEIEVDYHLTEIVTGTVARIRLPRVMVHGERAMDAVPSAATTATLPQATLLSGQWLAALPVRELLLEQLRIEARTSTDAVYTLQLSGQLREAQLRIHGELQPPAPQPAIALSLSARNNGEARVILAPAQHAAESMLDLQVNPVSHDQDPLELNGLLTANFKLLYPMVVPWFKQLQQVASLEGNLQSQWQARISEAHWQLAGEAAVRGLGGRWHDQLLPRSDLTTSFDIDPQRALLQSSLRVAGKAVVLETNGSYQFASGYAQADLKLLPVVFSDSGFILSRLLDKWSWPFDITAGRVAATGQLTWQHALALHGVVQLDKVGGHYNQLAFTGLSGALPVGYDKGIRTTKDAQLRVAFVDVGFPVEKIVVQFALAPQPRRMLPLVRLKHVSAELLGGKAQSGPFDLDFERLQTAVVVQLEGLGLHEIMQLEQQEGLQGSGVLDGQLPIEISTAGLVVTHGHLAARAPGGNIRYTPTEKVAAMAQTNASINMLVQALSDFQYHVLDVTTDYNPRGDLALQVRLEGRNPTWQQGQPVHLNLNLEENIPTLLRSLQLSDDISEQVRKRYQTTPPAKGSK